MDMVYLPRATPFVEAARELGIRATDGMEMLVQQGAVSFERWWGRRPSLEVMRNSLKRPAGS
jgi:shikimate dehydrogenase